jgi:DNA mismatch endonuclease Vsr
MMPGTYERTPEIRIKLGRVHKGSHLTAEHKQKIGSSLKGRKFSPEHRMKLSKSALGNKSNQGKHASIETKQKISKGRLGKFHSEESKKKVSTSKKGCTPWNKGKHHTIETRKKISEKSIFRIISMRTTLPMANTKIERMIQDELSIRGYGYYLHYSVLGRPDISFPDKKIAIFCDGCYWHNCLQCKVLKNKHMIETANKRNKRVNTYLAEKGWLVLRYWEHEIKTNPVAVVDEIEDVLMRYEGDQKKLANLYQNAKNLRMTVLDMCHKAKTSHIGSCLSCIDILTVLYMGHVLRIDPKNPLLKERDYFILSKGHAGAALYATLAYAGFFPISDLDSYRAWKSPQARSGMDWD